MGKTKGVSPERRRFFKEKGGRASGRPFFMAGVAGEGGGGALEKAKFLPSRKAFFFGRLKNEMFYGDEKEYTSFEVFSKAISDYIDYYNNRRIQAKTKWMPPIKFREASMM